MLLKAPRWSLILVFQKDKQHSTQQSESDLYGKYLSDNYAPVLDELVSRDLKPTRGALPADLDGCFLRVGANPIYPEKLEGEPYFWFDGDGMIHSVELNAGAGSLTYRNKFVLTKRLKQDIENNGAHYEHSQFIGRMMAGKGADLRRENLFDENGELMSSANTALLFHNGRLFALSEADKPYHVTLPDLETVGRFTYDGALGHNHTAHPKLDPVTGEVVLFGSAGTDVHCSVASADGALRGPVTVSRKYASMMHDCAITANYTIILDFPSMSVLEVGDRAQKEGPAPETQPARFGVLPRNATQGANVGAGAAAGDALVRWFETDPCYCYHTANAWEEEDEGGEAVIVLVMCRTPGNELCEWRLRLADGVDTCAAKVLVPSIRCDFPVVNPRVVGRRTRYVYAVTLGKGNGLEGAKSVIKVDVTTGQVWRHFFVDEGVCAECFFVAKSTRASSDGDGGDDDEGYLLTFVWHEHSNSSSFYVLDAKTFAAEPIAMVPLPQRVPFGFHALWVGRKAIETQQPL